jgi:transcription initiation factor TFIIIB Brf1 subunit/transcription initiation factor TFIIB
MKRSIKCQNCDAWNDVQSTGSQKCSNCGKVLKDEKKDREKKLSDFREEQMDKWMFTIHEDDNKFVRGTKKVGNAGYYVFISILAFFAWLLAILPA